jgi:hypothetical protein
MAESRQRILPATRFTLAFHGAAPIAKLGFGAGLGGTKEVYPALTVGLRARDERIAENPMPDDSSPPGREAGWVECEECGNRSFFQARQRGRVQICPHCNAYMDA